jgi:hypothetical protein
MSDKEAHAIQALLEEYKVAQSVIAHIDIINWTMLSIFFTGSLTATGLVLQDPTFLKLFAVFVLSALVLSSYLLVIHRTIPLSDKCKDRMRRIEDTLNQTLPMKMELQHNLKEVKATRTRWIFRALVVTYLIVLGALTVAKYVELF